MIASPPPLIGLMIKTKKNAITPNERSLEILVSKISDRINKYEAIAINFS